MQSEEITRLCAKLNYGMKLRILKTATSSASDEDTVAVMKKLKGLVELDNFNVFSFVCRIHSLAAKVMCCSDHLPIIAPRLYKLYDNFGDTTFFSLLYPFLFSILFRKRIVKRKESCMKKRTTGCY